MAKKNARFVCVHREGSFSGDLQKILVDRETGVNYLFCKDGYGGGLTVLLGPDGKPVITPRGQLPED